MDNPIDNTQICTCKICHKKFKAWYDGVEVETEICSLCDMEYLEGMLFDRDNFGDQ